MRSLAKVIGLYAAIGFGGPLFVALVFKWTQVLFDWLGL